jgi:hypothetical protein
MGYTENYVIAEGMRRARPDLTRENFVSALETLKDYQGSGIASPRTFTNWHHVGNLTQQIMVVKNQKWVPVPWQAKHESEILSSMKKQ